MNAEPKCPNYGSALPGDARGGLCPRCLLRAVLSSEASPSVADRWTPPPGRDRATADAPTFETSRLGRVEPTGADERTRALRGRGG
jgi:hypothetical protein